MASARGKEGASGMRDKQPAGFVAGAACLFTQKLRQVEPHLQRKEWLHVASHTTPGSVGQRKTLHDRNPACRSQQRSASAGSLILLAILPGVSSHPQRRPLSHAPLHVQPEPRQCATPDKAEDHARVHAHITSHRSPAAGTAGPRTDAALPLASSDGGHTPRSCGSCASREPRRRDTRAAAAAVQPRAIRE